jgi:hypothetical protein
MRPFSGLWEQRKQNIVMWKKGRRQRTRGIYIRATEYFQNTHDIIQDSHFPKRQCGRKWFLTVQVNSFEAYRHSWRTGYQSFTPCGRPKTFVYLWLSFFRLWDWTQKWNPHAITVMPFWKKHIRYHVVLRQGSETLMTRFGYTFEDRSSRHHKEDGNKKHRKDIYIYAHYMANTNSDLLQSRTLHTSYTMPGSRYSLLYLLRLVRTRVDPFSQPFWYS